MPDFEIVTSTQVTLRELTRFIKNNIATRNVKKPIKYESFKYSVMRARTILKVTTAAFEVGVRGGVTKSFLKMVGLSQEESNYTHFNARIRAVIASYHIFQFLDQFRSHILLLSPNFVGQPSPHFLHLSNLYNIFFLSSSSVTIVRLWGRHKSHV